MEFTDPRLPALYAQRKELNAKIGEIEESEAGNQTVLLLGKCFRFRNNYSVPESDADYWWLYSKVVAVEGRNLTVFEFQRDSGGETTIRPRLHRYWRMDGHEEISSSEFRAAWDATLLSAATDFPG